MNKSSIKLTIEICTAGIDIKASPLAETFVRILEERLQAQVTPEFVTYCLYMAAKSQPATSRRKKKQVTNPEPAIAAPSAKPEGLNEK